jgi:Ca2+-binding EF-hand superfamily protein
MKPAPTIILAIAAITIGLAYAADDKKEPGFNVLDKNNDGYLTRTEAAGDSGLAKKFKDVDRNGDGKISRAEYLAVKTRQDVNTAKNKVEKALEKDDKPAASGATK